MANKNDVHVTIKTNYITEVNMFYLYMNVPYFVTDENIHTHGLTVNINVNINTKYVCLKNILRLYSSNETYRMTLNFSLYSLFSKINLYNN